MKKTPLAAAHERLGARMVDFSGWYMPVQYGPSILDEVRAVREAVGLFDLSHMGRCVMEGPQAVAAVDRVCTNHAAKLAPGDIRYSLLCNEQGGVIDDLLIYGEGENVFMVVNASNNDRDQAHMREATKDFDASLRDLSDEFAMLALQGPRSVDVMTACVAEPEVVRSLGYYKMTRATFLDMPDIRVSRTGYTGEDGFEVYFPAAQAERAWEAMFEAGEAHGLRPIGLGARDTLRLEAGMALYGHELDESINPLEAGLQWAVKFAKDKDFIGRSALERVKAEGPARRLVGLFTEGARIARQGYAVQRGGEVVGFVCSGTQSPTLGKNIATAIVKADCATLGGTLDVDMRGRPVPATITSLPFYQRAK